LRRDEQQWEEKLSNGWRRGYRSESITYFGQPPAVPVQLTAAQQVGAGASWGLFAAALLVGAYLGVAAALHRAYKYTKCAAPSCLLDSAAVMQLRRLTSASYNDVQMFIWPIAMTIYMPSKLRSM
jgi:hypothetical protein